MVEGPQGSKRVLKIDEYKIVYSEVGKGETLLLLHGLPSSGIWKRVLPALSTNLRCINMDLVGLGGTEAPRREDYTLTVQAELIRRFLDRVGLERVHLLGHDLGGIAAQIFAVSYPHRIIKLILSNSPAYDNWPNPFLRRLLKLSEVPGGLSVYLRMMKRIPFARSRWGWGPLIFKKEILTGELLEDWIGPLISPQKRIKGMRMLLINLDTGITEGLLPKLKQYQRPTMLLWGCDNPFLSPSWAIRLYHDIPGARRLELIPFTGLFPQEEDPHFFVRAILDFLLEC